jgi:hypothetical protein
VREYLWPAGMIVVGVWLSTMPLTWGQIGMIAAACVAVGYVCSYLRLY